MSFRRFDPNQNTVSQYPLARPYGPQSSDSGLLSDNIGHTHTVPPTRNPPSSSYRDSYASIPITLPPSGGEPPAHGLQDQSSFFSSSSNQVQLGLDSLRPATPPEPEMADSASRTSAFNSGGAEYGPRSYSHRAHKLWESAKDTPAPTLPVAPVSRHLLAALMGASGLLIVGFIGYSLFNKNGQQSASQSPPIIEADSTPVKVMSQTSVGTDERNKQDMRIYEKINSTLPGSENASDLITNTIIRKDEIPLVNPGDPLALQDLSDGQEISTNADSQAGLSAPKQVKTVVMRPDGTIVSQSVKSEKQSEQRGSSKNMAILSGADEKESGKKIIASQDAKEAKASLLIQKKNSELQKVPSRQSEGVAPNGGRGFSVQLAATSSEKEALVLFETLKRRHGVLGEKTPTIYKVNLAGKTVYRLRLKTPSQDESTSLCQAIQTQGGSCFVARN